MNSYAIVTNDRFTGHFMPAKTSWLNDLTFYDADHRRRKVETLVDSGDCFETLANSLDQVSLSLAQQGNDDYIKLQRVINTLLYLQKHYQIIKR